MEECKLGNLVKIKTGRLDANASSKDGEYPFFTCSRESLRISSFSHNCKCVLVAGNGDLNVKFYEGKFDAYQRTYIIESKDESVLDTRYLYWFLSKYVEKLRELSIGGVIKYIKLNNLTDPIISLPPLEDQKRIVKILDQADSLIQKRKQAISLLDEYLKSLFLEMFGDPVNNSKRYEVVCMKDITTHIKDGPHVSPKYSESGNLILSTRNVRPGELVLEDVKYVSQETFKELTRMFCPQRGDVLVTKGGTTGYAKAVDFDWPFCVWVHIAVLRPKSDIDPLYLESAMNSNYCYRQSQLYTHGIANRDLGLTRIAKIKLLKPPFKEQQKYALIMQTIGTIRRNMLTQSEEMENNYKSLIQKAFKGELIN